MHHVGCLLGFFARRVHGTAPWSVRLRASIVIGAVIGTAPEAGIRSIASLMARMLV